MKILIVGGCFTCQSNIKFERLYHQTLKEQLLSSGIKNVEIQTIRYERIAFTKEKIDAVFQNSKFDMLLFHLRAEPLMRMVKLYYKYIGHNNRLKHSLNFPFIKILKSEKFDMIEFRRIYHIENINDESNIYHYLRELNYLLGSAIGNKKYAFNFYSKFILKIMKYCDENSIDFILCGPVSRPFSKFENKLSYSMNSIFKNLSKANNINYLELLGEKTINNRPMFFPDGQHVSQDGHDEIAMMLSEKIKSINGYQ